MRLGCNQAGAYRGLHRGQIASCRTADRRRSGSWVLTLRDFVCVECVRRKVERGGRTIIPARLSAPPRSLSSRLDFVLAKNSLCPGVGLRQVTDHGKRVKSGLRICTELQVHWSSRRFARLPIVRCVEEALSHRRRRHRRARRRLVVASCAPRVRQAGRKRPRSKRYLSGLVVEGRRPLEVLC